MAKKIANKSENTALQGANVLAAQAVAGAPFAASPAMKKKKVDEADLLGKKKAAEAESDEQSAVIDDQSSALEGLVDSSSTQNSDVILAQGTVNSVTPSPVAPVAAGMSGGTIAAVGLGAAAVAGGGGSSPAPVVNRAPSVAASQSFTVYEGSDTGTAVGTVAASDADGDAMTYSITSGNADGFFAINTSTGVITLTAAGALALNADGPTRSYSLTVQATDSKGLASSATALTINVGNVNDNSMSAVADANSASNTVSEDAAVGGVVGITALATDADRDATVTYSLINANGTAYTGPFAINSTTGVVTVSGALDHEVAASHEIIVKATSSDGSTNNHAFTIAVTNVNDNSISAIVDTNASANTVAENAAIGAVAGVTALATDADRGAAITYSLTDNAGGRFAINPTTGVITVASALDYETSTSHTVTVQAISSDGSSAVVGNVPIYVTNVDDNALSAVTDNNAATNTVAENSAVGTVVGITASATDADRGTTVTYSLINANGTAYTGPFAISETTGVVTVNGALDYETATSHEIIVKATSSDGVSTNQAFTIAVTNVNDNAVSAV